MPNHFRVPLAEPETWRNILRDIPHGFAHTWENCHAMHLTTGMETSLSCFELGSTRIVCPVAKRTHAGTAGLVTPYGFSGFAGTGDWPGFPGFWAEVAREEGWVDGYISIHPSFDNESYYDPKDADSTGALYLLDLTLPPDRLYANLDRSRRRDLSHWRRSEVELVLDRAELTAFVLAHYGNFMASMNASRASYFSEATLESLCGGEQTLLIGARQRGQLESVHLYGYTPFAAEALICARTPGGQQYTTMLHWEAIQRLSSLKIPTLNFGGGARADDKIAQAKERLGARKTRWTVLKQVYDSESFDRLCRLANRNPGDWSGYFPPYLKP